MSMGMVLGEMEPHTRGHEKSGDYQRGSQRRTDGYRQDSADKGRQGEVGAGPRGPQVAQRQDKQRQAQSVAHEAEQSSAQEQAPRKRVSAESQGQSDTDGTGNQSFHARDPHGIVD